MADYDSRLPVRTEINNSSSDMQISIADGTTASQLWEIDANNIGQVNLNDGTNALVIGSSGELTVDLAAGAEVALATGTEVQITDGTETLLVNTDGSLSAQLTDGTNALVITASGEITVVQASGNEIQITDGTDTLAVNADGSINVVTDATPGTDVHVNGTTEGGVPGTPKTVVDRVQSGADLYIRTIQATCSGKFKVELKTGTDGSETTKATAFGSTSSGFVQIDFPTPIVVADADSTLLIITNNDKANADVYGFINGYEL